MLPNTALKPWYDRVVWLFVSRNFKEDVKDLEALRTHDRFGISSWPQMIVFDPTDDRVLLDPPRDLPGFIAALGKATQQVQGRAPGAGMTARHRALRDPVSDRGDDRPLVERLGDPNPVQQAIALEAIAKRTAVDDALLDRVAATLAREDEDVVVYLRALRILAARRPAAVLARAGELLAIENDPLRYEVLELLRKQPRPELTAVVNRLFAEAGASIASRNPNVLRMRAAPCLAAAGDAESIAVLAPLAQAANWRNGTTRVVLTALATLAARLPAERARIEAVLLQSFPPATAADDAQGTRASLALMKSVLEALGATRPGWQSPGLPAAWDEPARTALLATVRDNR